MIKEKSIAVNLLLTILTCGIYGLVWFITITDDVAYASDDHKISGGVALLLTIVTCGIYSIYWSYIMGKKVSEAKEKAGLRGTDNSVLYLVLCLLQLNIINYCLIQGELNEIANS